MIELGRVQELMVVREKNFGVYLGQKKDDAAAVLLPKKHVPEGTKVGDKLKVFIYKDSEDRLIATTSMPKLELGGTAVLKVKDVSKIGAFLDWGLDKDLLLPFREQPQRVEAGRSYLVRLYIDEKTGRIVASAEPVLYRRRAGTRSEPGGQIHGLG
jgi:predicted RNA-binding protein (virulence factor B family)